MKTSIGPSRRRSLVLFFLFVLSGLLLQAEGITGSRERLSLDRGWLFQLGDVPFPVPVGHDATYQSTKAGRASGAAAPEYDDTLWRQLDLPHDWVVEREFDPAANVSQGFRPRGVAWYRRHFRLEKTDKGRRLELQFDGVATHCTVWVNGMLAWRNWCGYTSFHVDFTPYAKFGDDLNTIAVRVDADAMEGWWYEGGGIYRHTWLQKTSLLHIATDGLWANPVRSADGEWTVQTEVELANDGPTGGTASLEVVLEGPEGASVGMRQVMVPVASYASSVAKVAIPVPCPRLWSTETPTLYTVRASLSRDGVPIDATALRCGLRTIRFDPQLGFFLNDQPMKIKGVCGHQDHAGVGVAVPDSLWDFRLGLLKEMGANAYRCAHHPPSAEFLDACDRLGVLVMDENRNFSTSPEAVAQLEWMVRRDRSHPSVILWSVFNEEPMQATEAGCEMVRRLSAAVKRLDSSRPVTAAQSWGFSSPANVSQVVDVVGFNYQIEPYDAFHEKHPALPLISSEDTSAYMTRGAYEDDDASHVIASYDQRAAPWGATHRDSWSSIVSRPYLAGTFVWTGFDYHGEPTPFSWPSVGSFFGCMDLCGFPKTAFYLRQAQWRDDRPILQVIPHWNWPGREGRPIRVCTIGNAERVNLFLNGVALGERKADASGVCEWQVPYSPGRLEAVGYRGMHETARCVISTSGEPASLRLRPARPFIAGDGADAVPVTVEALDAAGNPVPTADVRVDFAVRGGRIIGLGNGNPNSHEPEQGDCRRLFNGLAQVIVQASEGPAPLTVEASARGLLPARAELLVQGPGGVGRVAAVSNHQILGGWMLSPAYTARPAPTLSPESNDMNSWQGVAPGAAIPLEAGCWRVCRSVFVPHAGVRARGGLVRFTGLSGRAELWLDGRPAATIDGVQGGLDLRLPPGEGPRVLSLLFEGVDAPAGLTGLVYVEP